MHNLINTIYNSKKSCSILFPRNSDKEDQMKKPGIKKKIACQDCKCRRGQVLDGYVTCGHSQPENQEQVPVFYGTWRQCSRRMKLANELVDEARQARLKVG